MTNVIPFPNAGTSRFIDDEAVLAVVEDWLMLACSDRRVSSGAFVLAFHIVSQAIDKTQIAMLWSSSVELGRQYGLSKWQIKKRLLELEGAGFIVSLEDQPIPALDGEPLFEAFPKSRLRGQGA